MLERTFQHKFLKQNLTTLIIHIYSNVNLCYLISIKNKHDYKHGHHDKVKLRILINSFQKIGSKKY